MYLLRPATDRDYDFLYRLHVATMKPTVAQLWGWDDDVQPKMFRDQFDPAARRIIVVDGRDVGVLEVERRPTEVYLSNIEIAPDRQRRGLGAAINWDLLTEARPGAARYPTGQPRQPGPLALRAARLRAIRPHGDALPDAGRPR